MLIQKYLNSSIGKKIVMSFTGIFLILFLLVHCYINANIFFANPQENFNKAAHFMGSNFFIRIMEIGLFIGFLIHIYQGFSLYFQNRSKRPVSYKVSPRAPKVKWYSKSMTFLGTIILLFLIIHLVHFWIPSRFGTLPTIMIDGKEYHDLYIKMTEVFSNLIVVIVYVLACFSLAWHLLHGFNSAFQTLGIQSVVIKFVGIIFSIFIPTIFAFMPIYMYFQLDFNFNTITLVFNLE